MCNSSVFIIFLTYISIMGCKENSTQPPISASKKQETPLQTLVANKTFDTVIVNGEIDAREQGFRFSSLKNGNIIKLGCYMPNNLTYRVSLWDCDTKDLITAIPIKVIDSTKFNYQDIIPISIKANKEYLITINNRINNNPEKVFVLGIKSTVYNEITFPIKTGLITIEAEHMAPSETLIYPTSEFIVYKLYGIPDFVFEPE